MHPQRETALAASEQWTSLGHRLVIVPQVLYEFWVVATRPASRNGLDWTAEETHLKVIQFLDFFTLLRDERAIFDPWFDRVTAYEVKGKSAHDARLVAAMTRHGIRHILTFNVRDFSRYPDIVVMDPNDLPDDRVESAVER